jgi:ligand-binding sensor domain-containing protein/signal transduction histidine kinase/DNA-binding NarL/FixJ family response regulator
VKDLNKKMKKSTKLLFVTIIFCFCLLAPTHSHSHSSDDIKIQRVLDTGIFNTCISQDKDGLLWISAWGKGLFCYDGNELKEIKILKTENTFPIIWSIFIDKEGIIWFFVANHGLYSYDKKTGFCKEYKPEPENPNSLVNNYGNWLPNNMAEDKEGLIWIGTADGLNSFDKQTDKFTLYKHNPNNSSSLSHNSVWTVFVDKNGTVWVGTEDGLNYYNKKTNKFYCYRHDSNNSNSLSSNEISAIAEDKDGNLWIGTKSTGIDKFNLKDKMFTNYRHDPNNSNTLSCDEIHSIMIDRLDNLWVCNEGNTGIDCYHAKTNTFTHYNHDSKDPNTISSNNRLYSFEDNNGIIWFIDGSGSICKCLRKQNVFKNYAHDPKDPYSIGSNDLTNLYEDKENNVWLGTSKGGLCLYTKNDKFERFNHVDNDPASLPGNSIFSILEASDGKLCLGIGGKTISLFDIKTKKVLKSFINPYSDRVPCLLTKDNKNSDILWFASFFAEGLFNLNTTTGKFTQYRHTSSDINSVSDKVTFSILQDENILWIGTGGDGLTKFDKITGTCTYYKHDPNDKNSISGNIVLESYIDSKGNFWVTTEDGGLNKFDKKIGQFTSYGMKNGFPSNSARHIVEDKEGYLWISTDSGIAKFNPETSKVVRLFTIADGLPSNQFDRVGNPLKDSKGHFWFSTLKGACKFDSEDANHILQNPHIPSIVLTSFRSKEETYNEQGVKKLTEIILPWQDNSFEFTFAALDYTEPLKNQLAFKLEGIDEDWHYIGTNHFGQYVNLSPGKYTLQLKGANSDGLWNNKGISVTIIIEPPFWATWWFKGKIAIICLGIILLIIQHRRKTQKKRATAMRDHAIASTTSIVAHDVRKPFIGLKMMLQMLPKLTLEQTKNYTEDLDISIRKVDAMLMDIMEASREMKYELIPENILTVLDLAIKDVSRYHPNKHIDFYYSFDKVALIALDEQRMCRAFENIIDNAFGFVPDKEGIMWFSIKEKNNKARIIIGNSHSHISEDQMSKIFLDKFTSGKKGGTGLGLSIVTKVINGHKGSVSARNVQAAPFFVPKNIQNIQGVEFEIILPLTEKTGYSLKDSLLKNSEEAKVKLGMVQKKNQLAGSSEIDILIEKFKTLKQKPNLLILDDESIYRMRVRDVLENFGDLNKHIHVYDAGSYKEAIDVLGHSQIDYLICDIDLSDQENDGFSVLSKTIEKYPNCMVLIHTNRKEFEDINKAKSLGACGFCPKPITEAILVDLLLDKELWPYDSSESEKAKEHIIECVKGVPDSSFLIVNDDQLALKLTLMIIKSHIDPEDSISIATAKNYMEARDIIDNEKPDILISDFNLESSETGIDICRYMKKKSKSVRIIYSGITEKELEELKETNKDYANDIFSSSCNIQDMLARAFEFLRKNK